MPLSEEEQRILQEIEQQFHAHDPDLAGEIGNHSIYTHSLRQMRRAGVLFGLGVVVLVAALVSAGSFLIAFAGFLVMLGAALWFEHSLRRMGRAGKQQLARSISAGGLREYLGITSERLRSRRPQGDTDTADE